MQGNPPVRPRGSASSKPTPLPPDPRERAEQMEQADLKNPLRRICFYSLVILAFVRFSMLHQLLTYNLGINLYLLYIFGIPSIFGFLFTGGIRRVFRFRATIYWVLFAVCLMGASLLSSWMGGSVGLVSTFLRTDFNMLFLMAGLAVGWKECRTLMLSIAFGCIASEISFKLFSQVDINGRTSIAYGTVANSSDYPAHLVLVLPFLLWVGMSAKFIPIRIASLLGVGYGCYLIIESGSRGGFVAIIVSVLAILLMATPKQRIVGAFASAVMMVSIVAVAPPHTFQRILSFSEDGTDASQEALESSRIRKQLLKDSIWFAVTHPVFGLGPGRFSETEGLSTKLAGMQYGLFYEAHNSFMTIASECGTPALIFYLAGIVSSYLLLNRIGRSVGVDASSDDIRNAVLCIKVAVLGFCTAVTFVNFAYTFYLPAISGLIEAIAASFPEKMQLAGQPSVQISRSPALAVPATWRGTMPGASIARARPKARI